MVQTNNELYKEICENYGITIETGVHTNNYYLHLIAETVCQKTYTELECNGKYLKDIAEELSGNTYTSHHFNNFYLKEICTAITQETYSTHTDNFYLEEWAINVLNREESKLVWLVPPSNMEYGDFNASGVLTDKNDSSIKISGATVNLVIGSTVVDTAVTDSNGIVTFEGSPVHVGTHSFKLVFNGNQSYESSESSVVTITVSKETTYLNVEEYDSTGYSDGTVYITGQLLDNDSPQHSVTGETVKIIDKSDDTVLGTAITDNQGYFDCDLELSASNYAIRVIYEGTDDYNSSYEDISIEVIDPYLEVIVNKPVLSYADTDSTALSAVVHSGASVGDIRVDFSISDAQFTTYGITNNHGECTALDSYQSGGLGDIELVATATVGGMSLTKTYGIRDAIKYYSGTLTTTTVISVPNLPTDFEMSWKAIRQSGKTAYMKFGLSEVHVIYGGILSTRDDLDNIGIFRYVQGEGNKEGGIIPNYKMPSNVEKTITMRHENNTASISVDGYSTSFTNTALTDRDYVRADINGGSIKEILIMPL